MVKKKIDLSDDVAEVTVTEDEYDLFEQDTFPTITASGEVVVAEEPEPEPEPVVEPTAITVTKVGGPKVAYNGTVYSGRNVDYEVDEETKVHLLALKGPHGETWFV